MKRCATSFTIKLLASLASFGFFMLILGCAAGIAVNSDSSYAAEDYLSSAVCTSQIMSDMNRITNQVLAGDGTSSYGVTRTNLRYVIIPEGQAMITNLEGLTAETTAESARTVLEMVANQTLVHYSGQYQTGSTISKAIKYEFYAGVDASLPAADIYADQARSFAQIRVLLRLSIYIIVPAVLIYILLMAFLMRTTGMIAGQSEVRLAFLDRIYSDIFTGGMLILAGCYAALVAEYYRYALTPYDSNLPVAILLTTMICLPIYFLVLIWFLSICRRVRAGVLFRGSLTGKILRGIGRIFRLMFTGLAGLRSNSSLTALTALGFGVFILGNSLLSVSINNSSWAFLFYLVFNLAVFLILCNVITSFAKIARTASDIAAGNLTAKAEVHSISGQIRQHAQVINNIGDGLNAAVAERMKSENFKTELIANVSHDLKTPLTSIINYIDLLKKQPAAEQAAEYLKVLERNSLRLKDLTNDLLDFSKFSTGNIQLQMERLDIGELIRQGVGEYQEKLSTRGLQVVLNLPEDPAVVMADGRQVWRILENLLSNARKYALQDTRVYIDLVSQSTGIIWIMKNISASPLNITADALMERFVRGDSSRNTEGSGLGLSIARSLVELQGGHFNVKIDGDLFKTVITLPSA